MTFPKRRSRTLRPALLLALGLLVSTVSLGALSESQRFVKLPDSIYVTLSDDPTLDRDADGLKDDHENRLADAWRPYFIFDQKENARKQCHDAVTGVTTVIDWACVTAGCAAAAGVGCWLDSVKEAIEAACSGPKQVIELVCKGNVSDDSLRPFEPVVLYQVRPIAGEGWPRRLKIEWAFLYRLDGGYRASNVCTDYHYGDTQSGQSELLSSDGLRWEIKTLSLWSGKDKGVPATSAKIQWTPPRGTWGQMPDRPSPIVFASAGKHHQYISAQACEDEPGLCDDDCGGGAERLANLTPQGAFTNVGEYQTHPADQGSNIPFVNDLAALGFPDELVWEAKWSCHCPLATTASKCFTGGLGEDWSGSAPPQGCVEPTPVLELFDLQPPPRPPLELGPLLTFVVVF